MDIKSVYKYMPHYNGSFFDNFLLRATPRYDLNDPFEFLPSQKEYELSEKLKGEWVKDRSRGEFSEIFRSNFGIISFTETKSNLLMWAHYAQKHTGLVIEFNPNHIFFNNIERVKYDNIRPDKIDFKYESFFLKSDEWIYEKEYRIIKDMQKHDNYMKKDCDEVYPAKDLINCNPAENTEMYMFKIPKESIYSITFGYNINTEIRKKILDKINNDTDFSQVKKWDAILSDSRFNLEFKIIERE